MKTTETQQTVNRWKAKAWILSIPSFPSTLSALLPKTRWTRLARKQCGKPAPRSAPMGGRPDDVVEHAPGRTASYLLASWLRGASTQMQPCGLPGVQPGPRRRASVGAATDGLSKDARPNCEFCAKRASEPTRPAERHRRGSPVSQAFSRCQTRFLPVDCVRYLEPPLRGLREDFHILQLGGMGLAPC